ncbi:FMN-binding negative transcriptional regulator [Pseudomonas sp. VI4.1]|uniref:FMN-binding negative transcriptional regulator n=1 Tax=Pseudomonas sp. VI4.1 TaxID=1941346 RepID=UPI0009CDA690|nr:FMN-binding negative transcriptional regulator [Pseudomonas sp. VI4.1]OPK10503.1 hypothetical protein BZ163_09690 [Pseudomonas sp. VI4.1]
MPTCPFHYPHHRSTEQQLIDRFIDAFPLATITSRQEDVFISSHIPLLRQSDGSLFGHVDVKNPQFNKTQRLSCQIIFMGPSAYIPPHAYVSNQLPTWNYLAVHMQAQITVSSNPSQNLDTLQQTAERLSTKETDYRFDPDDARVMANLHHIRSLKIQPEHVEGRFKLSQDKPAADASAALEWLLSHRLYGHRGLLVDVLSTTSARSSN